MTLTAEQLKSGREILGAQIKRLREQRYWTLTELADKVDVSPSTIMRIENGTINPTLSQLMGVLHALGYIVTIESAEAAASKEMMKALNRGVYPTIDTE